MGLYSHLSLSALSGFFFALNYVFLVVIKNQLIKKKKNDVKKSPLITVWEEDGLYGSSFVE